MRSAKVQPPISQISALLPSGDRESAARAARIAAYGSANAVTPASYTLRQAIEALARENGDVKKHGKRRRYEKEIIISNDGITGPMFSEVSE